MKLMQVMSGAGGLFAVLLCCESALAVPSNRKLDSPLSPVHSSASRSWLLDEVAPPAAAIWPMARADWMEASLTPRLRWSQHLASAGSAAVFRYEEDGFGLLIQPVLATANWQDQDLSMSESGNGLDLECSIGKQAALWMHFRDSGLSGDLELIESSLYAADRTWIWTQVDASGTLTHDEQRAGAVWTSSFGKSGRFSTALLRDHLRWGSGLLRTTVLAGDRAPSWPMALITLEHGALTFQQTVGELHSMEWLDDSYPVEYGDRIRRELREKWLIGHRIEWTHRLGSLAAGEIVIMGDRRPGPGYLIPGSFFWSEQHAQGDRDNSMLFLDGRLRLPARLPGSWMIYGELTVDDYTLGDLGEEFEGQRTASLLGLSGCPLSVEDGSMQAGSIRIPGVLWMTLEHARQRPFFGGHFFSVNRFDHGGQSLTAFDHPNSRALDWELRHEALLPGLRVIGLELMPILEWSLSGSHLVHGANPDGVNVGGDRYTPHAESEAQEAPFLAGDPEVQDRRLLSLKLDTMLSRKGRNLGSLMLEVYHGNLDEHSKAGSESHQLSGWQLAWGMPF